MTGAEGLGSAASSYFLTPPTRTNRASGLSGGEGAAATSGGKGGTSTSISPLGQLVANLQQLQSQDPAKFKQVVSEISDQLQSAAQQQGQNGNGFLSQLADKFKSIANGGSLSQLQTHHHHHAHGGYDRAGRATPPPEASSGSVGAGVDIAQLFASISSEVDQALNPSATSTSV